MIEMFIYAILNKKTGKAYIGQTANPKIRFRVHRNNLLKGAHVNIHLQRAWTKYGERHFEFKILKEAKTQQKINKLEKEYIERYKNNGKSYNIIEGGKTGISYSEMSHIRWKNPNSMNWRITMNKKLWAKNSPFRKKVLPKLLQFARDAEWKSKNAKKLWAKKSYRQKFEKKYGKVISPTGKIHEIIGLRKFSRKFKLDPSTLSKLCRGTYKQYKGWRIL